ncbi:tetratricopeptide repeat protein [Sphingobacterium detergens]
MNLYPNSPGTYANRGNIHRFRGNFDLAIADYSKFLELSPNNTDVLYARADSYREVTVFDKAISDYSRVIEINPAHPDIYFDRVYSYIRLKDYENSKNNLIFYATRDRNYPHQIKPIFIKMKTGFPSPIQLLLF